MLQVFIDADKAGYIKYLDRILASPTLLAKGGFIAADNVVYKGAPWVPDPVYKYREDLVGFNSAVRYVHFRTLPSPTFAKCCTLQGSYGYRLCDAADRGWYHFDPTQRRIEKMLFLSRVRLIIPETSPSQDRGYSVRLVGCRCAFIPHIQAGFDASFRDYGLHFVRRMQKSPSICLLTSLVGWND